VGLYGVVLSQAEGSSSGSGTFLRRETNLSLVFKSIQIDNMNLFVLLYDNKYDNSRTFSRWDFK
jgi:hypothetical protein